MLYTAASQRLRPVLNFGPELHGCAMTEGWQSFEVFDDEASAQALAGRLRIEGVHAVVHREGLIPGLERFRVIVPEDSVQRAHRVMATAERSEAELTYLATGKLGGDRRSS